MSNVAIDLTKTVKEIITTMKTAIDNLNTDVSSNKTAIDNLKGQVLQAVYPVGSVYVSITDSRDPADILGFGTWEALPAGYGLVAQGTATAEDGSTLTFTAGQKSGEFKHQITVGELPNITGEVWNFPRQGKDQQISTSGVFFNRKVKEGQGYATQMLPQDEYDGITMSFGNGEYHNNITPCVASNIWYRTA